MDKAEVDHLLRHHHRYNRIRWGIDRQLLWPIVVCRLFRFFLDWPDPDRYVFGCFVDSCHCGACGYLGFSGLLFAWWQWSAAFDCIRFFLDWPDPVGCVFSFFVDSCHCGACGYLDFSRFLLARPAADAEAAAVAPETFMAASKSLRNLMQGGSKIFLYIFESHWKFSFAPRFLFYARFSFTPRFLFYAGLHNCGQSWF